MADIKFGDPEWRAPLTGKTSDEILQSRKDFNASVALVCKQNHETRAELALIAAELEESKQ